jgi:GNAT superfamily N-acetyltransferase
MKGRIILRCVPSPGGLVSGKRRRPSPRREGKVIAVGVLEYTFFEHGFISLVFVDPEERRTGIGEMLFRYPISICRTPKVFSSTNRSNVPIQALFGISDSYSKGHG